MAAALSNRDLQSLQDAVRELYELRELDALRRVVPQVIQKLIPAEGYALAEGVVDPDSWKFGTSGYYGDPQIDGELRGRMERSVPTHPFTLHVLHHGPDSALMFSDFLTQRQFMRTELYNEFYRLAGVRRSLSTAIPEGSCVYTLNALRYGRAREFSERDRTMLTLLRPHYGLARRNAVLYEGRRARRARPLEAFDLTPRETEVATWLARGKTNREIATILGANMRTVEKHVEKILEKLSVENRTTAAVMITDALGV